jgi:V-type H+-transporting ATPase subunit a
MKVSIIFAFVHMLVGIIFKAINLAAKKEAAAIALSYIPQFLMFISFVGYLSSLIIVKWLTNWKGNTEIAPSIITTIVDFSIKTGNVDVPMFDGHLKLSKAMFSKPFI